jgi:hypothetical protein
MPLALHNRKRYPLVLLFGFAVVVVIWWRFEDRLRPELLLTAIGGVAGLTYFLYRQHIDETKLFKELFTKFNRRYDALNDHLNAIISEQTARSLSTDEKEHLFTYFNLCAEEYFFYESGYIDRRVWESWSRGMKFFSGIRAFGPSGDRIVRQTRIMVSDRPIKPDAEHGRDQRCTTIRPLISWSLP